MHLQRTDENVREIAALAEVLGEPTGLDGLLDDLKYAVRRARVVPRLLGRAVREAYRWDAYDERDELWYPQGISTSADSSDTEDVRRGGEAVLVTTWYSTGKDGIKRGSRVTFVDLDSGSYRHVLLVSPVFDQAGRLTLRADEHPRRRHRLGRPLPARRRHQPRLRDAPGSTTSCGCPATTTTRTSSASTATTLHSFGHRYVLPVRFTYQAFTDEGHEKLRYSFMSLDRRSDPPALIAG